MQRTRRHTGPGRRIAVVIAAYAIALQAVLAGFISAQMVAAAATDPAAAAVICHNDGSGTQTPPDRGAAQGLCSVCCLAAAAKIVLAGPQTEPIRTALAARIGHPVTVPILIAFETPRVGLARAPPQA